MPSASSFVEVSIRAARQAQPFAVQTRNGRSVAVWAWLDAVQLARLLAVVEGEECRACRGGCRECPTDKSRRIDLRHIVKK